VREALCNLSKNGSDDKVGKPNEITLPILCEFK